MLAPTTQPKVLVVDDERPILSFLKHLLETAGYPCQTCASPLEALRILDAPHNISVVLSDMNMADMNGIDLCSALRAPGRNFSPYFILMTGYHDLLLMQSAFAKGVDDFLTKPIEETELFSRLRAATRFVQLEQDTRTRTRIDLDQSVRQGHVSELRTVVSTLAHDLRTPLGALRTTAEILGMRLAQSGPEVQQNVTRLLALIGHMTDTVRNVADAFSGDCLDREDWGPVDLGDLCRESINLMRSGASPNVELVVDIPDAIPLLGDATSLRRLLLNLVGNSLRHTRQGSVTITASPAMNGFVRLKIRDTGSGIAPTLLPWLGQPMALSSGAVRNEMAVSGTGLGLSICRRIVARHYGRIRMESRQSEGTRVTVWLKSDSLEAGPTEELAPIDAGSL